jgi:hypothetical protein
MTAGQLLGSCSHRGHFHPCSTPSEFERIMVMGRLIEVDLRNRASRSPTSKHHSFSEKAEIIALVEQSHLPARRTPDKLGIPAPRFIDGTIAIARAAWRHWPIIGPGRIASGIASWTISAARSSTWR